MILDLVMGTIYYGQWFGNSPEYFHCNFTYNLTNDIATAYGPARTASYPTTINFETKPVKWNPALFYESFVATTMGIPWAGHVLITG
jgi:hypothetical protein